MTPKERNAFILKWAVYSLAVAVLFILQTTVLNTFTVFGARPSLMSLAVPVIAMLEGSWGGLAAGIMAGVLCDSAIHPSEGFFTINYMLAGLFVGAACDYLFKKSLLTAAIWCAVTIVYINIMFWLVFYLLTGRAPVSSVWMVMLPESLYSAAYIPAVYFLFKRLYRLVNPSAE